MPWESRTGNPRIACAEPCDLEVSQTRLQGVVWNISVIGAYVVVESMPEVGQSVRLSFCLPDDPRPIEAEGRVAWVNPPSRVAGVGMKTMALPPGGGLEFTSIDPADRRRIEERVKASTAAV